MIHKTFQLFFSFLKFFLTNNCKNYALAEYKDGQLQAKILVLLQDVLEKLHYVQRLCHGSSNLSYYCL